jgi:3-hydroxy acid dehydrogenase / malonic semialdehyde reductase
MNKTILITGATSGFGKAIAEKFASASYNCIITGRRQDKLYAIADDLRKQYGVDVLPLVFDVQNREAVFTAINSISDAWQNIDILVNNANLDDWDTMIDSNVKGLLYVSKAVLPYMTNRKHGHIFNMGSIAAKQVYKDGNVYCASKQAVDAISQSMRIDLLQYGIKVTAIHPGAADTEFATVRYKGDTTKAAQTYLGYEPLHAHDIADIVFYCATLPAHVCINDLVVTCTAQANSMYFHK